MIVTDKKYSIEDQLLHKLNLMIKRLNGSDDVILPVDGDEGQGKTEISMGACYYVAYKTKRKYNVDNIFFDLDEVIKFAASTKEQIIHYDEAALGLLRTQWQSKSQQKFLQLAMIARKKKHFIVLCIPKFHRLPPYICEDRAIGMIHVYSHKNIHKGRYCYYKKSGLQNLYQDYQKKKIKNYRKHFSFRGRFIQASKKIFTDEQNEEYDKKKDEAILKFGNGDNTISNKAKRWIDQRNRMIILTKNFYKLNNRELSNKLEENGVIISKNMIQEIVKDTKPITATPL